MGKDLHGNELGLGFKQNKNGTYNYRCTINGVRKSFYGKTLEDLYFKIEPFLQKIEYEKTMRAERTKERLISRIIANVKDDKQKQKGVYLIDDGEFVKIGVAQNLEKRLNDIQVSNPRKIHVIAYTKFKNAYKIESILHKKFKDKNVSGEWFDILDEIKEIKSVDELLEDINE